MEEIVKYLNKILEDDKLSASTYYSMIRKMIKHTNPLHPQFTDFSVWSSTGLLSELVQWYQTPTRPNMWSLPSIYCCKWLFEDVIWTDASLIQLVRHAISICIKMGKQQYYKPPAEHSCSHHTFNQLALIAIYTHMYTHAYTNKHAWIGCITQNYHSITMWMYSSHCTQRH